MQTSFSNWLISAIPIILFLVLMLGFNWGGSRAGALSWLITVAIALLYFGADFELISYTYIKAFLLSLDVLLIIWTALFLYFLTEEAGTVQIIGKWLSGITDNNAIQGIFLGWLFPSFLQGMGGFGVPVAVAAPLLVSTGFSPIQAIVMASVGHGWGVTYGSMSSSFQTLMAVTGLPGEYLAQATSILTGISVICTGFLVTHIADKKKGILSTWILTLFMGILLAFGMYVLSVSGLWIVSITVPSLVALITSFFWVRQLKLKNTSSSEKEEIPAPIGALLPYIILVAITLIVNLVPGIKETLNLYDFSLFFPEIRTNFGDITPAGPGRSIKYLNHPGEIILVSAMISFAVFRISGRLKKGSLTQIIKKTAKRSLNTTLAIFSMVGIAVIMSHTQMTSILSEGISMALGESLFPLISPLIGALGAFITGSNNNSNVLFAGLQMQTAEILGLSVPIILAAQTVGAGIGSIMAPAKVILGCATVGLSDQEGKVIRITLGFGLLLVFIIGISALIWIRIC